MLAFSSRKGWASFLLLFGVVLVCFGLLTFSAQPVWAQVAFSATPSIFRVAAEPGKTFTGDSVTVANEGDEPLLVEAYMRDRIIKGKGRIDYAEPGHSRYSAAQWVRVQSTHLELQPGEKSEVQWSLTAPEAAEPGEHIAALILEGKSLKSGAPVAITGRIAIIIIANVPGPVVKQGEVVGFYPDYPSFSLFRTSFTWPFFPARPATLVASFGNNGTVHLNPGGKLISRGTFVGGKERKVEVASVQDIFPGDVGEIIMRWPDPPYIGKYYATAVLDYGGEKPATAATSFLIFPFWQTVGLFLAAAGIFLLKKYGIFGWLWLTSKRIAYALRHPELASKSSARTLANVTAKEAKEAQVLILLGKGAAKAGNRTQAYDYYCQALLIDPKNEEAWLGKIAHAPTLEESLIFLEALLLINPDHTQARQEIAAIKEKMRQSSQG